MSRDHADRDPDDPLADEGHDDGDDRQGEHEPDH